MGILSFIYSVLGYNLCATLFIAYLLFDYVLGALATFGARYVMESKSGGAYVTGLRPQIFRWSYRRDVNPHAGFLHPLDPRRLPLDGADAHDRPDHLQEPQEVQDDAIPHQDRPHLVSS